MNKFIVSIGKSVLSTITKISPKASATLLYVFRVHKFPNLKNPQTFNEKLTWLKLNNYNNNDLVTKCADKYAVREYVEEKIGSDVLNDLIGVYDKFDDIDFEKLPDKFALKCTHGSGYNIICEDKKRLNINECRKKVNKWMKEKYGSATTELQYTRITPKIIIEKYLCTKDGKFPLDYKFYCVNGSAKCVLVCSERENKVKFSYFDLDWNQLDYVKDKWKSDKKISKPINFDEMVKFAEKLSTGFPFVRVDLYNDNGKIIFGELTFTPGCCCEKDYNEHGDIELGKFINLEE